MSLPGRCSSGTPMMAESLDERQFLELALDFDREHLVAADDQHVLAAVADGEVALVVHRRDIAGVQVHLAIEGRAASWRSRPAGSGSPS